MQTLPTSLIFLPGMFIYALTTFLGAFLVFQVQPIMGKFILPWFGGGPGVWTSCLLFFQLTLLAGYCYAHLIALRLSNKAQAVLHGTLLLVSLALLPIVPDESWKATELENPTWRILALLAVTVGVPYALLSSTAPLVQSWFAKKFVGRSPYRLYALSNAASLLALLSYPFVFEPWLRLADQAYIFSAGYGAFVLACGVCAYQAWRGDVIESPAEELAEEAVEEPLDVDTREDVKTSPIDVGLWLSLAATGTVMLMATTNQMCQDVAAVPFLWVLPLALYLITFIIAFDHERWYHRGFWTLALVLSVIFVTLTISNAHFELFGHVVNFRPEYHIGWQITFLSIGMFSCVMCCHGELVKLRPPTRDLTLFYLMISAGGALGGVFVAVIAPMIFDSYVELQIGLVASCVIVILARRVAKERDTQGEVPVPWRKLGLAAVAILAVAGLFRFVVTPQLMPNGCSTQEVDQERNFYGVLKVRREFDYDGEHDPRFERLHMTHGTTLHGCQYVSDELRNKPSTYYVPESGVGVALTNHPRRTSGDGKLRIGVVGLGVGTLAAFAQEGDYVRMYEINPAVERMAREHFWFLSDAEKRGADVDVLLGDARVVMEQQLARGEAQEFDVLVIDAFSSDAIPVHLLTRECFDIYREHLAPGGVMAVHVSNHHLDLAVVVRALAQVGDDTAALVEYFPTGGAKLRDPQVASSHWILVANDRSFFDIPAVRRAGIPWPYETKPLVWTDNYSSLLKVLK